MQEKGRDGGSAEGSEQEIQVQKMLEDGSEAAVLLLHSRESERIDRDIYGIRIQRALKELGRIALREVSLIREVESMIDAFRDQMLSAPMPDHVKVRLDSQVLKILEKIQ